MTDHRPRLGILFFTSGWFRDVGIQSSSSGVTEEENRVAADIVERVARFAEPVFDGVLFSEAEAERAAGRIVQAGTDGLLVSPLMWCEDQIMRAALKSLKGHPIILCTFFTR